MKFMKLGSKPDSFVSDGNCVRYIATDLASDVVISVGDVKFYLHKFPLSSKSARLAKLVASTNEEIDLHDIPGGPIAFEICTKFCYGVTVTLNSHNVVAARCAAEYLEMHETVEKGNLIYKIDVFLNTSIFRAWKDSVLLLQTTKPLLPLSEDLKLVSRCIEAIASKASVDTSQVDWSYTYHRKKLTEENIRYNLVPRDWWVEDLCELDIDLFERVISNIRNRGIVSSEVVGEALKAYIVKRLPGLNKGLFQCGDSGDTLKARSVLETIVWLLPAEKGAVSCSFLFKVLKASILVGTGEMEKNELIRRIGRQLEEARPSDLLIPAQEGEVLLYDVDMVQRILKEFMMQDQNIDEIQEMGKSGILTEASKLMVAKLVDGYLTEIARDPNLASSTFVDLAEMVSGVSRPSHDGLYRAIDMYLKEHPSISKSERKRMCRLMDCKKLSVEACTHAVQNERLPMRVVMQVLYFEQVRAAASSGSSTPDLPKGFKDLNGGSHRSSRSTTTNTDEDWDAVATAEELKALKAEVAALRLGMEKNGNDGDVKNAVGKTKGLFSSQRIFSKIWSRNSCTDDHSGSDSLDSHGSGNP